MLADKWNQPSDRRAPNPGASDLPPQRIREGEHVGSVIY